MNGKCDLSEFRAHSKDCGIHIQNSTRTADRDRTGDTGDISGTDRSGEAVQTAWKGVMEPSEASFF